MMRTFAGSWLHFAFVSVALSSMLAACGGGSGGSTSAQTTTPATPVVTTPPGAQYPGPATPATQPGNQAPTISGTASTSVTAGQSYSFTPSAADADKDAVTFTIANKPAWATFSVKTGALTGTPAAKDVGTYSGIEIAATDGKDVTAMPAFGITVSAVVATNSVSLSWTPPTQNADGSTLTDLSGYKIHYGTQTGTYTSSVTVGSAGVTRYDIDTLPKGKVYLAMTAVNAAGAESDFSQEVSITVN